VRARGGQRGGPCSVLERAGRIRQQDSHFRRRALQLSPISHAGPEISLVQSRFAANRRLAAIFLPTTSSPWVESHGIAYHEKKLGQLFAIIPHAILVEMHGGNATTAECSSRRRRRCCRSSARKMASSSRRRAASWRHGRLVIATGGLSLPKLGATDFAYRIARQFGLKVLPVRAGTGAFTFSGESLDSAAP